MSEVMKRRFWILLFACLFLKVAHASEIVKIDPYFTLTFPNVPSSLDTLGQHVFDYSDETGYYACIVQYNAIKEDKLLDLDFAKFYQTMYEKLQHPDQQCQLVSNTPFFLGDIRGMEFFTRCKEDPEFPDVRYKRILVYKTNLYIIDHWTFKSQLSKAEQRKNEFFQSMVITKDADNAIIPSAIPSTKVPAGATFEYKYLWGIGLILLAGLWLLFRRKSPKE